MTIRSPRLAATLLLALPLAWTACGGDEEPETAAPSDRPAAAPPAAEAPMAVAAPEFADTEWKLVALEPSDGAAIEPAPEAVPTLQFQSKPGPGGTLRMLGFGGCNRFFGDYSAGDGGSLSLPAPLGATRMACPEPIMSLETSLMQALTGASGYSLDGDELTIEYAGGSLRFSGG